MEKFTITQFKKLYPNDAACMHKIFQLRYTGLICPKCESVKEFSPVKNRRSYQCPNCAYQLHPTAGTIFENSGTPLTDWFLVIYMQTTTRNGVSAKEVERTLSVCYKTALRMCHQIKKLMSDKKENKLGGIIEVDEMYIGMQPKNKHVKERLAKANSDEPAISDKTAVIGFVSRDGDIRLKVMDKEDTFKGNVTKNVSKGATVITDGHKSYRGLKNSVKKHETINHSQNEFVRGNVHTNTIEGVWSIVRRTIYGTHIHVSDRHLQKYLNEIAFRYANRHNQESMFEIALQRVV